MEHDARDVLWNRAFDTYYDSLFEETVADWIVDRWQIADDVTKVLVALTALGSGISGWALWNDPEWRNVGALGTPALPRGEGRLRGLWGAERTRFPHIPV